MLLKAKTNSGDITTFLTLGTDFTVFSIADLVSKVADNCEPRTLQELVLYAHGSNGSFSIGNDSLGGIATPSDAEAKRRGLEPLSQFFGGSAGLPRLILCVCESGRNPANLLAIANSIRAPVYGCEGDVRPLLGWEYGWWSGDIVVADPFQGKTRKVAKIPDPPLLLS